MNALIVKLNKIILQIFTFRKRAIINNYFINKKINFADSDRTKFVNFKKLIGYLSFISQYRISFIDLNYFPYSLF